MTLLVYFSMLFICICIYIYCNFNSKDRYKPFLPNIDIDIYVISWKKVNDNAVKIYNEVSTIFPSTYFIDCDENSNNKLNNTIKLTDNDYYGIQFNTAIQNSSSNKVIGIVTGDIKPNFTDWNTLYNNTVSNFTDLEVGIYAPYETRTGWQKNKGDKMFDKNLYLTDNTDCTVWFLSPEIVSFAKQLDIPKLSPYGWGIDIVLCKYASYIGKNIIVDKSVQVQNPEGSGYDVNKAVNQLDILVQYVTNNNLIPDTIPNTKIHFITFDNKSTSKIIEEAKELNYFDTITKYTEDKSEIRTWIIKYKITLDTLNKSNVNDVIVYFDSHYNLSKDDIQKLQECVQFTQNNDLTCFKYNTNSVYFVRKCSRMVQFFTNLLDYVSIYNINEKNLLTVCIKKLLKNKVALLE